MDWKKQLRQVKVLLPKDVKAARRKEAGELTFKVGMKVHFVLSNKYRNGNSIAGTKVGEIVNVFLRRRLLAVKTNNNELLISFESVVREHPSSL
uniref:Uncharacterized protein n=1 Tax=viral metagenome TaxID=1070528 RepID=A0A6M3JJ86_9ZZZZ